MENMAMRGKRVLVTGGTGFVGSHLVEELVNQGAIVMTTCEYLEPGSYFVREGLAKKVTAVKADVVDYETVYDLVTRWEAEYIFHLAAQAIVGVAYQNPRRALETNVMGTVNVLESARRYGKVRAIVVASSDKAYGTLESGKYRERDPLRGENPYDVSKSAADLITLSYAKTYGVPAAVTRFGNIYGEGDQNWSRIVPAILMSMISGETLELRSDGKAVRDYLYVKDVVQGYLLLAEKIEQTKGEAYNFGSEETLSVIGLIEEMEKVLGKVNYKVLNIAKNEIPYQSLDYEKVKKLGWKPKYSVVATAKKMLRWYRG